MRKEIIKVLEPESTFDDLFNHMRWGEKKYGMKLRDWEGFWCIEDDKIMAYMADGTKREATETFHLLSEDWLLCEIDTDHKPIIYLDFDETIYKTKDRIIWFMSMGGITLQPGWTKQNMFENLPEAFGVDPEIISKMFAHKDLYVKDERYFYEDSLNVIHRLINEGYTVKIVTVGQLENNINKKFLIRDGINDKISTLVKDFDSRYITGLKDMYDKSCFDMRHGIHLDDSKHCLKSSSAKMKILFHEDIKTWKEFYNLVTGKQF